MNIRVLSCLLAFLHYAKTHESCVLDAGCGTGALSGVLRPYCTYLVGCDLSMYYTHRAKNRGRYDDLVLCDVSHLPFKSKSFFALIGNQLLEHLPKEDGQRALGQFDEVADRIFLTMPTEWAWTKQINKAIERGNIYEEHRSRWSMRELKKRGYTVRGYGARWGLSLLPNSITYFFPKLASGYIAIKI